jgi:phospholipid/cholesterol/gamma-HCH transport system permease protein
LVPNRYSLIAILAAVAISTGFPTAGVNARDPLRGVWGLLGSFLEWFGEFGRFCAEVARATFGRPFELREFLRQFDAIGSKSLPLAALAGAATGVVISLQTRASLHRFGAKSMLPSVIIFSIVKETGPIITGLVMSGRVGAGIGAELGSMRVTEQIDAMEVSAVNPYKFLAATRVLACMIALPMLTLMSDFCGIAMGWFSSALAEPVTLRLFLNNGLSGVTFNDFVPPTLKTAVYGLIIGAVSSFQGMRTKGGTEGVGRAATSSVVLSSLFIILADVVLVRLIIVFFE